MIIMQDKIMRPLPVKGHAGGGRHAKTLKVCANLRWGAAP